jgi:hypothetical protein
MASPVNKNINTSGGKTTDTHKLVYNMTTVADETADKFGGDDVDVKTSGDDIDDVNIDADVSTNTGSNAYYKNTGGAGEKETDSYDAEGVLDPVSKAALLSEYGDQWPKTPSTPSSSKTSNTGDDPNVDDNHDAVDDGK